MKNFKLILKSLINNEAVVTGARSKPWYFAIIMLFLSVIISVVPSFVSALNRNGSDFINSTKLYGYDLAIQRFAEVIDEKNFDMVIKESDSGRYLSLDQATWDAAFTDKNSNNVNCYQHKNGNEVIDLEVYFVDAEAITNDYLNTVAYTISTDESGKEVKTKKTTSFIIFSKYTFMSYLYSSASTKSLAGSVYGDYLNYNVDYNFRSLAKVTYNGEELTKATATTSEKYKAYSEGVLANWKEFYNVGYTNNKYTSLWQTTLLILGINFAIALFMGLMIFILTRGKNNPYRIYTLWEGQKIAYWALPAPAIISLVLGFLMANFSLVSFALVVGLRVMWLSMKTLKPENANEITTKDYHYEEVKTVKAKPAKKK